MLKDITAVQVLTGHRLHLPFEDGVEGEIDVAQLIEFKGVFAPLLPLLLRLQRSIWIVEKKESRFEVLSIA